MALENGFFGFKVIRAKRARHAIGDRGLAMIFLKRGGNIRRRMDQRHWARMESMIAHTRPGASKRGVSHDLKREPQ